MSCQRIDRSVFEDAVVLRGAGPRGLGWERVWRREASGAGTVIGLAKQRQQLASLKERVMSFRGCRLSLGFEKGPLDLGSLLSALNVEIGMLRVRNAGHPVRHARPYRKILKNLTREKGVSAQKRFIDVDFHVSSVSSYCMDLMHATSAPMGGLLPKRPRVRVLPAGLESAGGVLHNPLAKQGSRPSTRCVHV